MVDNGVYIVIVIFRNSLQKTRNTMDDRPKFQAIYDKLHAERKALLESVMTPKQLADFEAVEAQIQLIADTANSIIIRR
jgi:hypothetical protein